MSLPDFVLQYLDRAEHIIKAGHVKDIVFSKGTYQVEIFDDNEQASYFPFIQFDAQGIIQDAFCTCVQEKQCLHLAAAYLAIFRGSKETLEKRYEKSFWKAFCFYLSLRIGFTDKVLKKEKKGHYLFLSKTHKKLFELQLLSDAAIEKFNNSLNSSKIDQEAVPLKFSQISEEELFQWKKGQASHEINFELSFWSDLAKWLAFLQDNNHPYKITFLEEKVSPPNQITITFDGLLIIEAYISEAKWPQLIPTLNTVKMHLSVLGNVEEKIQSIKYDEIKKEFHVQAKENGRSLEKNAGYKVGQYIYIENVGFKPLIPDPLLEKKNIQSHEIGNILSEYTETFEKSLEDIKVFKYPTLANYRLFFDKKERLHIITYVHSLDETEDEKSEFFPPWYYVSGKGFYFLEDALFDTKEKVIEKEHISDFIHSHRVWLNDKKGFETHFGTLQSRFKYQVTKEKELEFYLKIELPKGSGKTIDFGDWLYIQNRGFYLKRESGRPLSIRPGLQLAESEVPDFIKEHEVELENIQHFFSDSCPIKKTTLSIQVIDENIFLCPKVHFQEGYTAKDVLYFDQYVFVLGEGFSKLPFSARLPERYSKERKIPQSQENYFLNYELEKLSPYISNLDKKLKKPKRLKLNLKKLKKKKRKNKVFWLVDLKFKSELGEVSLSDVWQKIHENKQYFFSSAGLINLLDARFRWLIELSSRKISTETQLLKLTTLEWLRLCIFEDISPTRAQNKDAQEMRKYLKEISALQTERLLDTHLLQAKLRPYQEIGVQWLWFLYAHGLSGILCDDMGLGKTHQTMALLASVMNEDTEGMNKYMVICPTSVIYHWEDLIKRFLPKMRVLTYYGVERTLESFEETYDLLLTSYGILRQKNENLKSYKFEVVVFDELQIAKNPQSQTHKSCKQIKANMRLGLTGTPIENYLSELKALFDVVLPNYLPAMSAFRDMFINPIERNQDPEKKKVLSKIIKPFILRRKKRDVLFDLPEKMEEVAYCQLSEEQQKIYDETLRQNKHELLSTLENEAEPVPYLHIFSMLSKLKQICNHPSLFLKDPKSYKNHNSGKWDLFVELLNEAIESGQKLVVFSQYLDMLTIIEQHLKEKNISFAFIKGATKKRHDQIRKFQEDPKCSVFVASLLAAGVGIDLTAGSVVIHYDRWWNPAKENQATDRVHRIGQNRGVQVFKLVTKNTLEEDIHSLIERKLGLTEELLGKDDSDQIKKLSREELLEIFRKT
jgi:SNF2 family DNA or RNA helicase